MRRRPVERRLIYNPYLASDRCRCVVARPAGPTRAPHPGGKTPRVIPPVDSRYTCPMNEFILFGKVGARHEMVEPVRAGPSVGQMAMYVP